MRYMIGVVAMLVLLGTSCSQSEQRTFASSVNCRVDMVYPYGVLEGQLIYDVTSGTTLTMTQPIEVQGLEMHWDGSALSMSFEQIETTDAPCLPTAPIVMIHSVLTAFAEQGTTQGMVSDCHYRCVFDNGKQFPSAVVVEELSLTIRFEDVVLDGRVRHN